MPRPADGSRAPERAVIALAAALLLLLSPLKALWLGPASPWFAPYLVWTLLVGLAVYVSRAGGRDGP